MKKILCMIIAAMMVASVSVNAVEVDEEVNDVEVVETVEDMPDEDVAEVADVDEPEDTPDEAPADLEDLPDLEDPVIAEPEDTPDADPDDDLIPVELAYYTDYKADTWYSAGDNVQWRYESATKTLRFKGTGAISYSGLTSPWEEYINQKPLKANDNLQVSKLIIEEGITSIPALAFNLLSGESAVYLPQSLESIGYGAFGGIIKGAVGAQVVSAIVSYGGTDAEWETLMKNTGDDNDGIKLSGTTYFQMRIPASIELSPTNSEYSFTMYKSNGIVVATEVQFNGTTISGQSTKIKADGEENYTGTGNNSCWLVATVNGDTCTIDAVDWTTDYEDYECSGVLNFNFYLGKLATI